MSRYIKPMTGGYDRQDSPINTVFDDETIPMPTSDDSYSTNLNPYEQGADNSASLPVPSTDDEGFWGHLRNWDQELNNGFDSLLKSNPVTSFLARAGQAGADTMTGGGAIDGNYDTGSTLANGVADIAGTGLGFMERLPGLDFSTGNVLDKAIGQPTKNALTDMADSYGLGEKVSNLADNVDNKFGKYLLNNAGDYATKALATGAEFGGYNGTMDAMKTAQSLPASESALKTGDDAPVDGKVVQFGPYKGTWMNDFNNDGGERRQLFKTADGDSIYLSPHGDFTKWQDSDTFDDEIAAYKKAYEQAGGKAGYQKFYEDDSGYPDWVYKMMADKNFDAKAIKDYFNSNPKSIQWKQDSIPTDQRQPSFLDNAEKVVNSFMQGAGEGMGEGMLFGAGGKALGDFTHTISGIGKIKPLSDDGNRVTFQDENGNTQDMNKVIFDNTVQSLDTTNPSYADTNLDDVFNLNKFEQNKPLENDLPQPNTNIPLQNDATQMPSIDESGAINKVTNRINELDNKNPLEVAYSKIENPNTPDSYSMNIPIPKQEDIIRPDFNPESAPTQQIVSSKQKSSLKDLGNSFATHVFDRNLPLQKINNDSYVKATNSANVGGIVDYMMQKGLVDANGNKIGDSLANVIKQIPKKQANDFWEYALQKHNIARAAEDKPIYYRDVNGEQSPYTPSESAARVQELEKQHPEWKEKANNITNWLDQFMNEWGVKTGVINEDLYKAMREQYPDYIPTNREFNDLEDFLPGGNGTGKKFVNQSTPIKKATGSQRNIIDPTENIMNLVNRTVRTAKYNDVGKSVLNAVEQNPEGLKDLAEIIPEEAIPKTKTDNIVRVLNDGEPTYLKINNKNLLGALNNINKSNLDDIDNVVKKTVNAFKSLITTKNPLFAVSNTARDLPTYLVNSKENNPLKALWNLGGAYKDILTKSDTYNQYKGLGGGSENFFNSEKPYKSAKELNQNRPLPMLNNAIEGFNNLFETAPRLAEFKNTLKKTGDVNQALYDAGEVTTNFSKGGDYTKKIDKYVPYLNAGVQGLSLVGRQFKNHPIATTAKGLATITAPTLALDYMNKDNKNYQALDNRTRDNYYLFPYGDGSKFIKIPKSRELGVAFGSLAERLVREYQGDKQAFKGFFKNGDGISGILSSTVADNLAPSSPVTNNILAPLIYNLPSNKDFAGRTIVPQSMQDRSPNLQYDEKTSELAKTLGNLTNLSPKQIDYVIKSYTGVIGQFLQPATTKSTTTGSKANDLLAPLTSRFTADPLYNNQSIQDFYDNMGKAKTNASDTNFENNVGSKDKTKEKFINSEYTRANKQISDLTKQSFQALQNGDMDKVKDIRQDIINIATQENKYMSGDGQLPMPSTELNSNIGNALNKKRSSEAKSIREEAKSIYNNYDLSAEEKSQKLQDLLNQAQQAPQKNPPKPRGRKKKQ